MTKHQTDIHQDNKPMEDGRYFRRHLDDRVLWLTLNEPGRGNALSIGRIDALAAALEQAFADPVVKVIVIAHDGKIFCAGHDLREMAVGNDLDEKRAAQRDILERCTALMQLVRMGDKPVVAAVTGIATAAGAQLIATCDLAIAGDGAQFCTPGVNLGGFCTTPLVAIGRNMHRKHAMEMALTGDMFPAEDAARFGLVNKVVPDDAVLAKTQALAAKIATKSGQSFQMGKAAFYRQMDMPTDQAYQYGIDKMVDANVTEDARRGMSAFFRKEKPVWQDQE